MGKKKIRINFKYVWNTLTLENFIKRHPYLRDYYDFELSENPDFLFFSCFDWPGGWKCFPDIKGDFVRVFYTGENVTPDMSRCDYSFSFAYDNHPNSFRMPNFLPRLSENGISLDSLIKNENYAERTAAGKKKFCLFLYSNSASFRNNFFQRLCREYKMVDSGGKCFNNIGERFPHKRDVPGTIELMNDYKFVIAFEHTSTIGYTTEKLVNAMLAGAVPLYWGNPEVGRDFNNRSFINLHDYNDMGRFIARIKEVDKNDEIYRRMLAESWFHNNAIPEQFTTEHLLNQFHKVFNKG
jgi:hypothetical protein